MKRGWILFSFFFAAHLVARAASGDSCGLLVTTSFGLRGSLTSMLGQSSPLVIFQDGYHDDDGKRLPHFTTWQQEVRLGTLGELQQLSSQGEVGSGQSFYAALDSKENLALITPQRRVVQIRMPADTAVTAAVLYRTPLRVLQRRFLPLTELQQRANQELSLAAWEQTKYLSDLAPYYLYVLSQNALYRILLKPVVVKPYEKNLSQALLSGVACIQEEEFTLPGRVPKRLVTASPLPLLDLQYLEQTSARKSVFVIPTARPHIALEVHPAEKVIELGTSELSGATEFLKVVSSRRVLVGSSLGDLFVIDPMERKIVYRPSFESPVWLRSVSMHSIDNTLEIWAVDARSRHLYRWNSGESPNGMGKFIEWPDQLPEGVEPLTLTSVGQLVPAGYCMPKEQGQEGFFSNFIPLKDEVAVERVLALGADGRIYAHVFSDGHWKSPRKWVSYPLEAGTP